MKACFKEKMMRQCYRERISLEEMEKPMAYDVNTILCQTKEKDHFPVVVVKIEVETSNFSGAQGTENRRQADWFCNLQLNMNSQLK